MADLSITNSQQVALALEPQDRRGVPAPIDGIPTWQTSDPTIAAVEPAADGLTAVVKAVGPVGTARITATADADLGDGVQAITGVLELNVTLGQAAVLSLRAESPTEQP